MESIGVSFGGFHHRRRVGVDRPCDCPDAVGDVLALLSRKRYTSCLGAPRDWGFQPQAESGPAPVAELRLEAPVTIWLRLEAPVTVTCGWKPQSRGERTYCTDFGQAKTWKRNTTTLS